MIPFDGVVTDGEATVNEASLTGESMPVAKHTESYVYAGTVLEEGELTIQCKRNIRIYQVRKDRDNDRRNRES